MRTVVTVFGTRPEAIKLAPVMRRLESEPGIRAVNVCTSQHGDLLRPVLKTFGLRVDRDLEVMRSGQTLSATTARILAGLDPLIAELDPDLVLVQGDTTSALAGALAGFNRRVPVAHVEAGLRTERMDDPFPEEGNRRLVSRLASLHLAATDANRRTLLDEAVDPETIAVVGNPVVDALRIAIAESDHGPDLDALLSRIGDRRPLVLTTHRRESFGRVMRGHLRALAAFVASRPDLALVFPVHPNPEVRRCAREELEGRTGVLLCEPLGYRDFLGLLQRAWLIVSDSGGIQEEAPSLGKPLLVLRKSTERPEAVEAGVARLVGDDPARLLRELEEAELSGSWAVRVASIPNPFGDGRAASRIVAAIKTLLERDRSSVPTR